MGTRKSGTEGRWLYREVDAVVVEVTCADVADGERAREASSMRGSREWARFCHTRHGHGD